MLKIYILLFTSCVFLNADQNLILLDELKKTEGWILIKNRLDSIRVYEKSITDMNLKALKVEKIITFNPNSILNTIMDINQYSEVMSNPDMVSFMIDKKDDFIYVYNHSPSPIPFVEDRHYIFKIRKISNREIEWTLLDDKDIHFLSKFGSIIDKNPGAIYLNYGAGSWNIESITENISQVSYALYMDSGGAISDYLNDFFTSEFIIALYKGVLEKSSQREE